MKHTLHDPRLHKLPYPRNLMLAIAKADLIDSNDHTSHKAPVINVNYELEEFLAKVPLTDNLSNYEAEVITRHYKYHVPLIDIADHFCCTSENIRSHRNHALDKLLKAYLKIKKPIDEPADELPTLEPQILSEIKKQLNNYTLVPNDPPVLPEQVPKHIKAARNSIKKYRSVRLKKQLIPRKFYVRSDGILYLELQDELHQHYIGEFYSYSNSNFRVEGIVVDISIAGILLNDWTVTHT